MNKFLVKYSKYACMKQYEEEVKNKQGELAELRRMINIVPKESVQHSEYVDNARDLEKELEKMVYDHEAKMLLINDRWTSIVFLTLVIAGYGLVIHTAIKCRKKN